MQRRPRILPAYILASLLVLLGLSLESCKKNSPIQPPPPEADTTSHSIRWTTTTLGDYSSMLTGLWGTTPKSVWAVGYFSPNMDVVPEFVLHYDGQAWQVMHHDSLNLWISAGAWTGIHGTSDSCLVIVGTSMNERNGARVFDGLAAFWNGRTWRNLHADVQDKGLSTVWVVSPTDIYAGGDGGCLMHYDGVKWSTLVSPTTLRIQRIWGLPTGEIYAVAADESNSLKGSLILRLDGQNVRQEAEVPGRRILSFWGNAKARYAVGEGVYQMMAAGGTVSWQSVQTPLPNVTLHAIGGSSAGDVVAAGAFGSVLHWNGVSWKFYNELYDTANVKLYYAALAVGGKYFLVGENGFNALVTIGEQAGQ